MIKGTTVATKKKTTRKKTAAPALPTVNPSGKGRTMAEVVEEGLKVYGAHTLEERALPDYRDGLTPVQRRTLWAAVTVGAVPPKASKKSAAIVGHTMGNYHPHGDASLYQSLVNLVNLPVPLFDGTGSFGSPALGIEAASQRYTEARVSAFSMNTLLDQRLLDVTPMIPTFDGSKLEPLFLPSKLPVLLLNGARGIAVAAATNIPAFTYASVQKAVQIALEKRVKAKKRAAGLLANEDIYTVLKPLSPTGGKLISPPSVLRAMLETGRGALRWRCDYDVDVKAKTVTITGFAPGWSFQASVDRIRAHEDVAAIEDLSADQKLKVIIRFRKSCDMSGFDAFADKHLTSSMTYSFNITQRFVTDNGGVKESSAKFRSVSVRELINLWLDWRIEHEVLAAGREASNIAKDIEREEAFLTVITMLDKVVALLKSKTVKDKVRALSKMLGCSHDIAQLVWQSPIGRFDRMKEGDQKAKIKALETAHAAAIAVTKSPAKHLLKELLANPTGAEPTPKRRKRAVKQT